MDDDQPIPVLAVEGILFYLKEEDYTCNRNNLERMYEELKSAFNNNETAVDIENILEKYCNAHRINPETFNSPLPYLCM